jgi:hypothetical protein
LNAERAPQLKRGVILPLVMTVEEAIQRANEILPGQEAPEGETDPRWEAIIAVGNFIEANPEEVWRFAHQWGQHVDEDLRTAIGTCLLEHLLESHFDLLFPRVEIAVKSSPEFADAFSRSWKFGQASEPSNQVRFDKLMRECDQAR